MMTVNSIGYVTLNMKDVYEPMPSFEIIGQKIHGIPGSCQLTFWPIFEHDIPQTRMLVPQC